MSYIASYSSLEYKSTARFSEFYFEKKSRFHFLFLVTFMLNFLLFCLKWQLKMLRKFVQQNFMQDASCITNLNPNPAARNRRCKTQIISFAWVFPTGRVCVCVCCCIGLMCSKSWNSAALYTLCADLLSLTSVSVSVFVLGSGSTARFDIHSQDQRNNVSGTFMKLSMPFGESLLDD